MATIYSYVVSVLTVNILVVSFGSSLPLHNTSIASSLGILASSCKKSLLYQQILVKLNECQVTVPPYHGKQAECLLFYDINKQLCQAEMNSNLIINEDSIAKLNEASKIESMCKSASMWNVSHLDEYPQYKSTMDKVFKNPLNCARVCGGEDVEVLDANFFCKYYSWGLTLLSTITTVPKPDAEDVGGEVIDQESSSGKKQSTTSVVSLPSAAAANQANVLNPVGEIKPSTSDKTQIVAKTASVVADQTPINKHLLKPNNPISNDEDIKVVKQSETVPVEPNVIDDPVENGVAQKPPLDEQKHEEKDIIEKDPANVKKDEDTIGDEMKERPYDEDLEYGAEENERQEPVKQNVPKLKEKQTVDSELTFSNVLPQKEMASNTFPEGYGEDNDNFFPVFLTGIIMVVLLYVLYHNKSKVSKMILGLIVEGRQNNRRRNSRGHSYRRLDTLEQAMNTNSSTPPSKIIY